MRGRASDRVRAARERAGLSQRALGRAAGVSWVTIRGIEQGDDPLRSTMARVLKALPQLRPEDVLWKPALAAHQQAWEFYRDAFGIVAEVVQKVVRIRRTGVAETEWSHVNVRALRGEPRDIGIVTGLQRTMFTGAPRVLRRIEADTRGFKARVIERREGRVVHLFQLPGKGLTSGLTYRRRVTGSAHYRLRMRDGGRQDEGVVEGATLGIDHPAELARLVIEFPEGYWPLSVQSVTWPSVQVPNPELEPLSGLLDAVRPAVVTDRKARRIVVEVARPLVGTKLAVGWEIPRQHG